MGAFKGIVFMSCAHQKKREDAHKWHCAGDAAWARDCAGRRGSGLRAVPHREHRGEALTESTEIRVLCGRQDGVNTGVRVLGNSSQRAQKQGCMGSCYGEHGGGGALWLLSWGNHRWESALKLHKRAEARVQSLMLQRAQG
eukprot:940216-Pelagomonas_calceolata.AAC.1